MPLATATGARPVNQHTPTAEAADAVGRIKQALGPKGWLEEPADTLKYRTDWRGRDVGEAVHGHARGHLQPEAGVAGNGQEALGHRTHVGGQLGLQRVEKDVGAQLDGLTRLHRGAVAACEANLTTSA